MYIYIYILPLYGCTYWNWLTTGVGSCEQFEVDNMVFQIYADPESNVKQLATVDAIKASTIGGHWYDSTALSTDPWLTIT